MADIPAISGLDDVSQTRVMLYQSGRQVHAPAIAIGLAFAVASRSILKAISTAAASIVYLTEAGREGLFVWKTGDYTARVAADTQEGIYIEADDADAGDGAWVRDHDGVWLSDWFGVPKDGSSDCSPSITAMLNLNNLGTSTGTDVWGVLQFTNAIHVLSSRLPTITRNTHIRGMRGAWQVTIFVKAYTEADDTKGILTFENGGWHLEDITLTASSGSGGACLAAVTTGTTTATANTGDHFLTRCRFSCGDFVKATWYIDGSTNVDAGGPGFRVLITEGNTIFGAAEWSVRLKSVQHWFGKDFFATSGGSASGGALKVEGTASAPCDDFAFTGLISGNIDLDRLGRAAFYLNKLGNNISNTANVNNTRIVGSYSAGTFQHNWDTNTCEYVCGIPYIDNAVVTRALSQQADITGDGTKAQIIFDQNSGTAILGWTSSLVYDTTTGKFTAKRAGMHEVKLHGHFVGLLVGHTQADLFIETYTAAAALVSTRQERWNPVAVAVSGRSPFKYAANAYMDAGHYMTISVTVTGSTKVVDIDHSGGFTTAEFKLI